MAKQALDLYVVKCEMCPWHITPEPLRKADDLAFFHRRDYNHITSISLFTGELDEPPAGGTKHDEGKPALALIPPEAWFQLGRVMEYGARKYGPHNWYNGISYTRLLSASLRHIETFLNGESVDTESGLPHLAHALFGLAAVLQFEKDKPELDDRLPRP